MRLTLRTLLAWLDGLLVPEEQRALGDRVAASSVATGLTQRILLATGRAELEAPRVGAWGAPDDANFTAQYLDNRLRPDQIEWFERICIQSDSRLAEVADCHGALADLSRLGDADDMSMSVTAPTLGLLKQVVHRSVADPGLQRAAPLTQTTESALWPVAVTPHHAAAPGRVAPAAAALPAAAAPAARHVTDRGAASSDAHGEATSTPARSRRRKARRAKSDGPLSDRVAAAAAVALLLVVGGGAVAWLNFGGRVGGPRRASVQGIVTFDGAPLENGVLVLLPADGTKGPTAGSAVSKGAFSIAAASGPVVGRYRVEIKALRKTGRQVKAVIPVGGRKEKEESEQFIPAKYNTASELEVEIKPGRNAITLELESTPKPVAKPGAASKTRRVVAGHEKSPPAGASGAARPPRIPG